MKNAALLLFLLPAMALAQQSTQEPGPEGTVPTSVTFPVERVLTPTAADLYCAGFIAKKVESRDKYVTGGLESPFTTQYGNGEAIFLNGKGYQVGHEYTVVRELADPNRYELYEGQWSAIRAAGHPYEELARVQIVDTRSKMAIARVEFSCDVVLPGDFVIPFVEKPAAAFHAPIRFDRFLPATGQTSGRIIMAKDFDSQMGTGGKVYLNIGSNQGLKVGDFVRAERSFAAVSQDPVDSLSFEASMVDPNQAHGPEMIASTSGSKFVPSFVYGAGGPEVHISQMPRKAIGEIVIIGTTPSTATGMIVFALEPVYVGDRVELEQQ
jgi:hypothetical protein